MTNKDTGNKKTSQTIDDIISTLCKKYDSKHLEEDILALFEDIIEFFSGREEEFIDFDSISMDQKEQIYNEIITIINLIRKLGKSADRSEIMKILSKNLIKSFKKNSKSFAVTQKETSDREEERIKQEFTTITLQELYKEKKEMLGKGNNREYKKEELSNLEKMVKEIKKSGVTFSDRFQKSNPAKKISSSKGKTHSRRHF
jgi:hypothetical protein